MIDIPANCIARDNPVRVIQGKNGEKFGGVGYLCYLSARKPLEKMYEKGGKRIELRSVQQDPILL